MITAIDEWSVEQIKSGQVIVTVASAIKELVENSLDSGATVITIKVNNYAMDGFSVQDNGSGIDENDFDMVARKHATSKLQSFEDLAVVATLGFRGEALASLCAVSNVSMITSTAQTGPKGHSLVFDHDGTVSEKKLVSSPRGTIVTVNDIFKTFPVRRKDFERNYKRQYEILVAMIQVYALISPVTLTLEHITKEKKRVAVLRSQGNSLIQRVATIFGSGTATALVDVNIEHRHVKFKGTLSKPNSKSIRPSSNRQLIYINGRPSDQKKIAKAIIDLYKQVDSSNAPFFILDMQISPSELDVNVSPDKREIMLHNEFKIIEVLQEHLPSILGSDYHAVPREKDFKLPAKQSVLSLERFSGSGSIIPQSEKSVVAKELEKIDKSSNDPIDVNSDEESQDIDVDEEEEEEEALVASKNTGRRESRSDFPASSRRYDIQSRDASSKKSCPSTSASSLLSTESTRESFHGERTGESGNKRSLREIVPVQEYRSAPVCPNNDSTSIVNSLFITAAELMARNESESSSHDINELEARDNDEPGSDSMALHEEADIVPAQSEPGCCDTHLDSSAPQPLSVDVETSQLTIKPATEPDVSQQIEQVLPSSEVSESGRAPVRALALNTVVRVSTSLDDIAACRAKLKTSSKAHIRNLAIDEDDVEEKLSLTIKKGDFSNMRIVGQFNLGFIVVVRQNDTSNGVELFVIDQHASDEIYNFERIQQKSEIERQPLVVPRLLELSAVEELTVINNMEVFERNGFKISVNADAEPGCQLALAAIPVVQGTVFNESDVHELINQIAENPGNKSLKVSKLRAVFAMRACRSSIMIGRHLGQREMKKVVENLGTLDKPWNCPHGRPTLRHITTLK